MLRRFKHSVLIIPHRFGPPSRTLHFFLGLTINAPSHLVMLKFWYGVFHLY
jgi:hypothetical protein